MRHFFLAAIIGFVLQLPFLMLMNVGGVHSAIGSVWVLFYLPALFLLDKVDRIGSLPPGASPFFSMLEIAVIQEILLVSIILGFIVLYVRLRSKRKPLV